MKNYLKFASAVVVTIAASGSAYAQQTGVQPQDLCTGAPGNGVTVSSSTTGNLFVRTAFTPQCSANVLLRVDQNSTGIWGGSVSTKGKNYFGGSSNGGAIRAITACSSACAAADAASGRTAAASFGSS